MPHDDLYQGKYRTASPRLKGWDYSDAGWYFVTICTGDRACLFGTILEGEMHANGIGRIAHDRWYDIESQFPGVGIDAFVVMPNHVHGIVIIGARDPAGAPQLTRGSQPGDGAGRTAAGGVTGPHNPMLRPESLGRVVRWYKGRCAFEMRKLDPGFQWQPAYYDHVIRGNESLDTIRNYITGNPHTWDRDSLGPLSSPPTL